MSREEILDHARKLHQSENLVIDNDAEIQEPVAETLSGVWVEAWVYIDKRPMEQEISYVLHL